MYYYFAGAGGGGVLCISFQSICKFNISVYQLKHFHVKQRYILTIFCRSSNNLRQCIHSLQNIPIRFRPYSSDMCTRTQNFYWHLVFVNIIPNQNLVRKIAIRIMTHCPFLSANYSDITRYIYRPGRTEEVGSERVNVSKRQLDDFQFPPHLPSISPLLFLSLPLSIHTPYSTHNSRAAFTIIPHCMVFILSLFTQSFNL